MIRNKSFPSWKGYKTHKIIDNLCDAFLRPVDTVLGALQFHLVALDATSGKTHCYTTVFVADLSQHLAASCHEVSMMLGVHGDRVLNDFVLKGGTLEWF